MPLSRLVSLTSEVRPWLQSTKIAPVHSNVMSASKTSKSHHCEDGKRSFPLRTTGQCFSKNQDTHTVSQVFMGCISSNQMPLSWPVSKHLPLQFPTISIMPAVSIEAVLSLSMKGAKLTGQERRLTFSKTGVKTARKSILWTGLCTLGSDWMHANPSFDRFDITREVILYSKSYIP